MYRRTFRGFRGSRKERGLPQSARSLPLFFLALCQARGTCGANASEGAPTRHTIHSDQGLDPAGHRAEARDAELVCQRAGAGVGDTDRLDPVGAVEQLTHEGSVPKGGVHRGAGGRATDHIEGHRPGLEGPEGDHPIGGEGGDDLLTVAIEPPHVQVALGAEGDSGARARGRASNRPEAGIDPQREDAVAARAAAARGARVLRAGAPRAGVAGLGARDRSPAGAGEGAGPSLAVGAGARPGATRGREDARAPLATAAHPRTHRRDTTGAALVGAVLADAILAGTAAGALGTGGRHARGEAPLAHDRARDGAAGAGRGARGPRVLAGRRGGGARQAIGVPHPIRLTLPPSGLAVGAHATRRGVGDGTRHAPPVGPAVSPRAARRAPHKVDARGDQDLTRGARAAEGLSHAPVGGARGTDRDHPRRGGGRRHARVLRPRRELPVRDAGARGGATVGQAAQAGDEAVLADLRTGRRADRRGPNDTLVAGLTGVERLPLVRAAGGEAHGEKGENQGAEEHPPR